MAMIYILVSHLACAEQMGKEQLQTLAAELAKKESRGGDDDGRTCAVLFFLTL